MLLIPFILVAIAFPQKAESYIEKHRNGKTRIKTAAYTTEQGVRIFHGKFQAWDKDGEKVMSGAFKNGVMDGRWTFFDGDGDVFEKGAYENGFRTGTWYMQSSDIAKRKKLEKYVFELWSKDSAGGNRWRGGAVEGYKRDNSSLSRDDGTSILDVSYSAGRMTDATRYFYPDRFAQQDWFIDPQGRPRKGKSTWIGAQHLPPLGCDPSFETRIRKFLEGDMTQTLKLMEDPLNTLGASVNLLLNADLESDKGLELVKGLSHKVLNLFPKSVDSEEDSVRIAAASLPLTEMELYSIHNLTRRLYGVWELANENPAIGEWDFHVKFGIPIEPNDAYQYRPRFPPEALQVHTDNFIEVSPRVEPSDRPRLNFVRFVHGVDETEKLEAQAAFLGMQWILNQQGEAGSWGLMDAKYGNYQPAITAQVLMLCSGFWPVPMESAASGPYVKGLRWLATQSLENGGKLADGLPEEVYQQAMAVQAMALALEVEKSKALGLALRDGANVLRTMQLPSGGWPEETGDTMEDLASTVAACIALSEAARVGITVEGGWMDRALNWANLEYQDDHWKVLEDGMPGLKPANQTSLSFQLGLLRCFAYGKDFPVSQRIELDTQVSLARPGRSTSADNLPLEYFLTGGLVIRQLSEEEWIKWQKANHEIVVGSQNRDGSWSPRNGPQDFQDPVKSTIEALGILQIDSHLPLVGRGGAENLRPNPQSDCKTSAGNSPKPFPAAILNRDFRPLILSSLPRRPLHLVAAVQGTR